MTDDPQSNSGATVPSADESAEIPILSAEKVPGGMQIPGPDSGPRSKYQENRESTARELAAIARQIAELESELRRAETRLDGASLMGPDREKFRKFRNGFKDRLDGLKEAQEVGQRRLDHWDLLLRGDAAENALATRRGTQGAASLVATQIRELIGVQVAELWQKFQVLRREDEQLRDVVRSVDQGRMTEVTTFSWTTGVDQAFASAIAEAISQSQRATRDLLLREKAKSPV
jgi:hypothetical protein